MIRRPFHFGPRSLSSRVFWLTVSVIFVVDILVMMPGMGREWQSILQARLTQAEVAVTLFPGAAAAAAVTAQTREALSALSETVAITLIDNGKTIPLLPEAPKLRQDADIDIDHINFWNSAWQANRTALGLCAPYLPVTASFPARSATQIEIIIRERPVAARLRSYVAQTIAYSMIVALVTGGLLYAVLDRLLVKPMRIMTANIVAFRRDPEYARLGGLKWLSSKGDDEVSRAARELVIMQDELRSALWRNAQLATLGTAIAKISHDLRNILAPALLLASRFRENGDPAVRQSADSLILSMERAVELVGRTAESVIGRPPEVSRSPVALRDLVDEVAQFTRHANLGMGASAGAGGTVLDPGEAGMSVDNLVPGSLVLPLDRNQIHRVLVNLVRNAAQAGASRATLTVEEVDKVPQLVVADNGPGLPRKALASLFRPFTGSSRDGGTGLGLVIARDLVRAHGGDLSLRKTGPSGTEFVMSLPPTDASEAEGSPI